MNDPLVLIMAGGTGGHVFPALALARELRDRRWRVVWLGTQRGLEFRVVPANGFKLELLTISGLRGKGALVWLMAPLRLVRALWQALGVIRRHRPALVVGLGGFVAGPGGIAAWLTRRPLLIHEQNAIAGFTNRQLARFASRILCAFPDSFAASIRTQCVGNPIRADIAGLPPPAVRFAARSGPVRVLVLGGSQGAARLNALMPHALARCSDLALEVRHQCGERWLAAARRSYDEAGIALTRIELLPFIEDMAEAYGWADLVVCRSGALTVSELAGAGVGSLLVPFPAATDDHQRHNAQWLVGEGAAIMVLERDLDAQTLAAKLRQLCVGRGALLAMAERARALARPNATRELADACVQVAARGMKSSTHEMAA